MFTLPYLTFDPLTLNVCSTSNHVMKPCIKMKRNRTIRGWVITRQQTENLKFRGGPHRGFHGRWTSIPARPFRAHNVPTYQIWAKSINSRRSYSALKVENLGPVRHFRFDRKLIFKIRWRCRFGDGQSYCRCSMWLPLASSHAGTQALSELCHRIVDVFQIVYIAIFNSSIVITFGWSSCSFLEWHPWCVTPASSSLESSGHLILLSEPGPVRLQLVLRYVCLPYALGAVLLEDEWGSLD